MNVSVIIPVYNAEKFVRKAVESALQLNEVKEVILIEDGSPDNAIEECKKLAKEYDLVKLFQHQNNENRGASASRNLGIEKSTSEFIAFLDADDYYLPNRFEKDRILFDVETKIDGCYNAIGVHFYSNHAKQKFEKYFGKISLTTIKGFYSPKDLFFNLTGMEKNTGYFSLNGLTIKRKALTKMNKNFNENLPMHQDTDFIIRLSYYCLLYPSIINKAVALRGVHQHNRITISKSDKKNSIKNLMQFWKEITIWAEEEKIDKQFINYFRLNLKMQEIMNDSWPYGIIKTHYYFLKYPDLLKKDKFFNLLHKHFFGENKVSIVVLKIKHKLQILLNISGTYN